MFAISDIIYSAHVGYHMHFAISLLILLCKNGITTKARTKAILKGILNAFAVLLKNFTAVSFALKKFSFIVFFDTVFPLSKEYWRLTSNNSAACLVHSYTTYDQNTYSYLYFVALVQLVIEGCSIGFHQKI